MAIDLAKYIVKKCINDDHPISNLQLQKILYYIQMSYLKRDDFAFFDDFEAWQFGPVVPNVYYRYCTHGASPIFFSFDSPEISEMDKRYIDPVIEAKRELFPWDLVAETHKPNGAWAKTYQNGEGNRNVIPVVLIQKEAKYGFV